MAATPSAEYIGSELELFTRAVRWAEYVARQVEPFLSGTVIEVGAGMGARTSRLAPFAERWVAVEPDAQLAGSIADRIGQAHPGLNLEVVTGTLQDVSENIHADAIVYIDVLEHIEDDSGELEHAATLLKPGGRLIVLSPAHQSLYSEFDRAIGHYRRYSRAGLVGLMPSGFITIRKRMLDAVGLLASSANRLLLRQSMPTITQIRMWDSVMVRLSRWLDPLLGYRVGKSVLVVFQKLND